MPGVEREASIRDGLSVVALRGDLDITGAAAMSSWPQPQPQPRLLRLLALTGRDEVFCVQASVEAAVASTASAGRGTVGGGLRCALHARGGQPHRIRVPG